MRTGFEMLDATEIDPEPVAWFNQYVERYKARPVDLTRIDASDILAETGRRRPDVVVGASPTKSFATSGYKLGSGDEQYRPCGSAGWIAVELRGVPTFTWKAKAY